MVVAQTDTNMKKSKKIKWVDSEFRFFATVSSTQDVPSLVRIELSAPSLHKGDLYLGLEDNLFVPLQEIIALRPYQPRNMMLSINPRLHEVHVCVENFWSHSESGGNSGRCIRRATAYVSGDMHAFTTLCAEPDTHSTKAYKGSLNGDQSGVKGLEHSLKGGLHIRRFRSSEASSSGGLSTTGKYPKRWICIDYSKTHALYCSSLPMCVNESTNQTACLNPICFNRDNLFLKRLHDKTMDHEVIAVVNGIDGPTVGLISSELSACLAPCIDSGMIIADTSGIYSEVNMKGIPHHRVWFRIDGTIPGTGDIRENMLQESLSAIPWWVQCDVRNSNDTPIAS